MTPRSFRVRLTLWYTAILAAAQILFAVALGVAVTHVSLRGVDRFLVHHGGPPPGGPPRGRDDLRRDRRPDLGPPGPLLDVPDDDRRGRRPPRDEPDEAWDEVVPRRQFVPVPLPAAADLVDPAGVALAARGQARLATIDYRGRRVRVFTRPERVDGRVVGALTFARDLSDFDAVHHVLAAVALVLLPLSLLLAAAGGLWLTGRALGPLREVTRAAAELGAEDLSRRLTVTGNDELAELARTFNGMIARLEASFEQQRRFTADASHELRTPLARAKVATSLALAGQPDEQEDRAALRVADQAADAMARLIDQLLTLARADAGQLALARQSVAVAELLHGAVAALPPGGDARITIVPPPEALTLDGDPALLEQVLVNLLTNALRHTPADGRVTLAAAAVANEVHLTVTDTGEGIAPEHLPRVLDRFYRADVARSRQQGGTGLGLAICRMILDAHGGSLTIVSAPGQGTTVTVAVPCRAE